ncbi:MAG: hypothetical protein ACF8SC_01935 [Phycisphaerales bacterium JB037]
MGTTTRAQAERSVELTEDKVEQLRGIRVNDGCMTARAVYAFRNEWNMPKHSTDALDEQVKQTVDSIREKDDGLRDAAAILGDSFTANVVFLDEGRFVAVQEVRGDAIRVLWTPSIDGLSEGWLHVNDLKLSGP